MKYPYERCGNEYLIELDEDGNPVEDDLKPPDPNPPPEDDSEE